MAKAKNPAANEADQTKIVSAFKGFHSDLTCNGFQFKIGETYHHKGEVQACASGFHACTDAIDVWSYYGPGDSRFCEVELSGTLSRHNDDTKIAAASITIKAELSLPQFIQRAVDCILSRVDWKGAKESNTGNQSAATNTGNQSAATNTGYQSAATNTGYRSAATNTGDWSAATNTGNQSAATNTGYRSAATNTGYRSAATNTGYQSAATNTGYQSAATNTGKYGVALASGFEGRAMGGLGCALFLVYRDPNTAEIKHAWSGIVGRDGIKPDVFYTLNDRGEPIESAA